MRGRWDRGGQVARRAWPAGAGPGRVPIALQRVAVRDVTRERDPAVDPTMVMVTAAAVVADPEVDMVVEVIGGIEPARWLVLEASGRQERGHGEQGAAGRARRGAVRRGRRGRGRPLVRGGGRRGDPDRAPAQGVAGRGPGPAGPGDRQRHHQLHALARWTRPAPATPRRWPRRPSSGYAEPDPSADVEGFDAAAKRAILAAGLPHPGPRRRRVPRGDHRRHRRRHPAAPAMGYTVKLLAIAEELDGERSSCARPPGDDPAQPPAGRRRASAYNAVFVEAEAAGQLMFYGRGAGGAPDRQRRARRPGRGGPQPALGSRAPAESAYADRRRSARWARSATQYHVALDVADRPACSPRWPGCSPSTACRSDGAAAGHGDGRHARDRHAPRPGARPRGDRRRSCAGCRCRGPVDPRDAGRGRGAR